MRAYRNVNLNIPGGMISLPVSIANAVGSSDPRPKVVGPNGEKVKQVYVNDVGEQVDYSVTKRDFDGKIVSQEDLKAIDESCKIENLEIIEICDKADVDFTRAQGAYYVYSHKKTGNPQAFGLFVQALAKRNGVALVKWTPSTRQQLLALHVDHRGCLVGTSLAFNVDFKEADEDVLAHNEFEIGEKELELAGKLLDTVSGNGDALLSEYDEAAEKRRELIANGEVPEPTEADEKPNPGNLMAALEASIEQVQS